MVQLTQKNQTANPIANLVGTVTRSPFEWLNMEGMLGKKRTAEGLKLMALMGI
jgi:hypothetical protein